jgi:hypothetical protein
MFSGIKGIVILDTCDNAKKCREEVEQSGMNLPILEVRHIGADNVLKVVRDAIDLL